jgi:hypothetical protein
MTANFEAIWVRIASQLRPGVIVRNWGAARRYTGGTFKIDDVERTAITISGGDMQMPRRVSKGGFEKVHAVWDAYLAGNYPRSRMTNLSQNTTYILSILHLAEQDQAGMR